MRIFGLIGRSLTHSFSHKYFSQKFYDDNINDCKYINIEIGNIKEIRNIIKEYNLCGFNVTIPYKETVIPFLDKIRIVQYKVPSSFSITPMEIIILFGMQKTIRVVSI